MIVKSAYLTSLNLLVSVACTTILLYIVFLAHIFLELSLFSHYLKSNKKLGFYTSDVFVFFNFAFSENDPMMLEGSGIQSFSNRLDFAHWWRCSFPGFSLQLLLDGLISAPVTFPLSTFPSCWVFKKSHWWLLAQQSQTGPTSLRIHSTHLWHLLSLLKSADKMISLFLHQKMLLQVLPVTQ